MAKSTNSTADGLRINAALAEKKPQWAQGELHEKQWDLFKDRYRPLERSAIDELLRGTDRAARTAGVNARRGLRGASAVTARSLGRRGVTMTGDQRESARASRSLNRARTIGTAKNLARREQRDRNLEGLGTMLSVGKGISGSAGSNLGAAANLASKRKQQNEAADRQHKQTMISTGVSLGAAALSALPLSF